MRYIIYKVLSIQICTQSSLEMCYVPCIRTSLICTDVYVDLLLDRGFLLGKFGLKEQFIKQDLLSCCTVFLPQPLPARPCPSDLQVVCHPQGLQHIRVVPVEPVPAQLRLGQPGPGAAHPAPRRAQRGPGCRETLPRAGGEGSLQWRREGTAAALPQVWTQLLPCCAGVFHKGDGTAG